jgi:anti-sigma factor RsiW
LAPLTGIAERAAATMSTKAEMSCREVVEVVSDYIDGSLPAEDRERLDAHLTECPCCVQYVQQMRETIVALGRVDAESLSPQAQERLLAAFRGWRER